MKKMLLELDPTIMASLSKLGAKVGKSRAEIVRNALYWVVHEAVNGSGKLPEPAPRCDYQFPDEKNWRFYREKCVVTDEWGLVAADQSKAPVTISDWETLARLSPLWPR
jgi:hypothetical protein